MLRVVDKVLEPSKIFVGDTFKLKIKIEDTLKDKKYLTTENGLKIISEDGKLIKTEWGD